MTHHPARLRRAFTLIELLVVMAIIVALTGLTMLIAPGALSKDRAGTAATDLTGAMQIDRARAMRDGLPRGVRLLYNPTNLPNLVTEFQHIESPPIFVPNPNGPPIITNPTGAPWVEFNYTTNAGAITNRTCNIRNLTSDQANQIATAGSAAAVLSLPTLGGMAQQMSIGSPAPDPTTTNGTMVPVTLNQFPDGALGGQTYWRTYQFGVYGPPRPLLGEPTYQLPQRSCVDLTQNLSSPSGVVGQNYDILFGPSGQLVTTSSTNGAGQVFLWVRDPTIGQAPAPDFIRGGSMIIVVVKGKSGAVGTAPVNEVPGNYYLFAQKAVSGQ